MRSHQHTIRPLLALGLAVLVALGCTLSPDDEQPRGTLSLRVDAVIDGAGKSARADLVEDFEYLSGRARIWSLPAELPDGCEDVCDEACRDASSLLGSGPLSLALDDSEDPVRLLLAGDLSFELDSPGSRYRLEVDLLERGRVIEGAYAGDLLLDSGIEVGIDSLGLSDVIPDDYTIDELVLCFDTDLVELDPADRCVDFRNEIVGTWDAERNELVMSYIRTDVEVEGTDADSVVVRLNAALEPAPIYSGCTEVEFFAVGGEPVEVTILLVALPDQGPGEVGEGLVGDLVLELYDDQGNIETTERGRATMARTEPLE